MLESSERKVFHMFSPSKSVLESSKFSSSGHMMPKPNERKLERSKSKDKINRELSAKSRRNDRIIEEDIE